jgi:hypothetical protein
MAKIVMNPPYVPATLAIATPTVSAAQIGIGGTEIVSVNVTNNGDVIGSFSINLLINSEFVDSQAITLNPRTSQVVSFNVVENTAGTYVASINQQHNVTFKVQ